MILQNSLGRIQVDESTADHCRNSCHRNPITNDVLLDALVENKFAVVKKSLFILKGKLTTNIVLLIKTAYATYLVVLRDLKTHLRMVTAYPASRSQIARYAPLAA
jgi:hypothetical protein